MKPSDQDPQCFLQTKYSDSWNASGNRIKSGKSVVHKKFQYDKGFTNAGAILLLILIHCVDDAHRALMHVNTVHMART